MLIPTTGSTPFVDGVVVDMFVVVVVFCTVGESCMKCCANGDGRGCAGGGVNEMYVFQICVVGFSKLDRCLLR